MRFREGGGLCYNREAVRDAGKQEMTPEGLRGPALALRASAGEQRADAIEGHASDIPAQGGMPFATESTSSVAQCIPFSTQGKQEDASRYCPVCSQRLESRRCKLVCNVCGYYMSCADYY